MNHHAKGYKPENGYRRLVDMQRGTVEREAFVSEAVFADEIMQIFNKKWIFLAHESEIPSSGSYVTRILGDAPVIVVRAADGVVHAVVNSCRHRGTELCRTDAGQLKRFVCPYHGWSFEHSGKLISTSFETHMPADMAKEEWGLIRVPRLEIYKGLIFGSWDVSVESLTDYLGEFRFYLEAFAARTPGGFEVLAPPHRWRAKANWKVGALNFLGDGQHLQFTHAGPLTLDPVRAAKKGLAIRAAQSVQVIVDGRHGTNLNYLAPDLPPIEYETRPFELLPLYESTLSPLQNKLLKNLRVGVGTIFPNLSFIETQVAPGAKALIFRLWHPISASEMEILSWILAERELSSEHKAMLVAKGIHNFGVAGVFEQDDVALWQSGTFGSRSAMSNPYPYSFLSALPFRDNPIPDFFGPGRAYAQTLTEISQLEFMNTWQSDLDAARKGAA
jgi:phenylpropionate dioxygenase-like ring-hydroxylating dioxygenase large terminal subunit